MYLIPILVGVIYGGILIIFTLLKQLVVQRVELMGGVYKVPFNRAGSLLRPFLCFPANQFTQKFDFLANLITYFGDMCYIY